MENKYEMIHQTEICAINTINAPFILNYNAIDMIDLDVKF
jgi:hypothetical protein